MNTFLCFKKIKKIVVLLLIFSIVFSIGDFSVLLKAFSNPKEFTIVENNIESERLKDNEKIQKKEINELRNSNNKTYLKDDGTYEINYYAEDVHYFNNGIFKEIDNSIVNNKNIANKYEIEFSSDDVSVDIRYNENPNDYINITYKGTNDSEMKIDNINKVYSKCRYNSIFNDVDLEYLLLGGKIKENIYLNKYKENFTYKYQIETTFDVKLIDNKIFIYNDEEIKFYFDEYVMYDANNIESKNIDVSIKKIDRSIYEINVTPSDLYLKNANYPVVIDPIINISSTVESVPLFNTTVVNYNTNTTSNIYTGEFTISDCNNGIKAFINITIPSSYINTLINSSLQYAYLNLPYNYVTYDSSTAILKEIVDLNETINSNTIFDYIDVDTDDFTDDSNFNHFDIYDCMNRNIYTNHSSSFDILFELSIDRYNDTTARYSLGDGGDILVDPIIVFGYTKMSGIYDYYTYENITYTDNVQLYIGHNNGNLIYENQQFNKGNIDFKLTYNSNKKNENIGYGNGFNISYNEKITRINDLYKLELSDGKEIFYKEVDNKYIAMNGDSSELEVYQDYYLITEGLRIKLFLKNNDIGRLSKIYSNLSDFEDNETPLVTITYTNDKISRITDKNNSYLCVEYSNGLLSCLRIFIRSDQNGSTNA